MEDLSFVSTDDLIKELTSRSTFAGMVLYSPQEHKSDQQKHQDLHLVTGSSKEITKELLLTALSVIDLI